MCESDLAAAKPLFHEASERHEEMERQSSESRKDFKSGVASKHDSHIAFGSLA